MSSRTAVAGMLAPVPTSRLTVTDRARGVLAYLTLTLGVAGSAAVAPLVLWALAVRGFR